MYITHTEPPLVNTWMKMRRNGDWSYYKAYGVLCWCGRDRDETYNFIHIIAPPLSFGALKTNTKMTMVKLTNIKYTFSSNQKLYIHI